MRRHKIDILKNIGGKDDYGDPLDDWVAFKSGLWTKKENIIGKEFYSALTTDVQVDAKFTTGYIKGVKSEMRVRHSDNIYEIIGQPVNIADKNMELLFYCRLVR